MRIAHGSPPAANPTHTIQINDVYVDEHGLIYANDRLTGGLYIIRYTGKVRLDRPGLARGAQEHRPHPMTSGDTAQPAD